MNNRDIDGKVIQYHTQKDEIKRLKSVQELLILLIIALTFSLIMAIWLPVII